MSRLILFTCLCCAMLVSAQEVYKSVDENGKIIFSDKPAGEKSEIIDTKLKNVQPGTSIKKRKKEKKEEAATSIHINSPTANQRFGPTNKSIPISAKVVPHLKAGHNVTILLNGTAVSGPSRSTTANVPITIKLRGKHSISAIVTDESGKTVASAPTVTIQVIKP